VKIPKLDRFRIAMGAGILLVVVIVGGLGWAFFQQLSLSEELSGETRQLDQAVETQRAHQAHLTATLTYVHTDDYVEEWAREEAKMAKPGEVVLIPHLQSESSAPRPTPTPEPREAAPSPDSKPFWTRWWLALIGSGE
jgi:cell division protein FtsB